MAKGPKKPKKTSQKYGQYTAEELAAFGPAAVQQMKDAGILEDAAENLEAAAEKIEEAADKIEKNTKEEKTFREEARRTTREPYTEGFQDRRTSFIRSGASAFDAMFPTLGRMINTLVANLETKSERTNKEQETRRDSETNREFIETVAEKLNTTNTILKNIDLKFDGLSLTLKKGFDRIAIALEKGTPFGGGAGAGDIDKKTNLGNVPDLSKFSNTGKAGASALLAMQTMQKIQQGVESDYPQKLQETIDQYGEADTLQAYKMLVEPNAFFLETKWKEDPKAFVKSFLEQLQKGEKPTVGFGLAFHPGVTEQYKFIEERKQQEQQQQESIQQRMGLGATSQSTGGGVGAGSGTMGGIGSQMPSFDSRAQPQTPMTPRMGGRFGQYPIGPTAKPNLSTISTKSGKSTQVAKEYASNFQGFINELEESGYEIKSLGGYADRANVNDPSKKSYHAFGAAIDINPGANPNRKDKRLITDMPQNISAIAAKYGLGWGGNWSSVKDPMHFSIAKGEGGSVAINREGAIPGEVAGGAVSSSSGSAAEAHSKDAEKATGGAGGGFAASGYTGSAREAHGDATPVVKAKLSSEESKVMQGAALSRAGAGVNTAAMQPPAPITGASLKTASSKDIVAQRDSASSKTQNLFASNYQNDRSGVQTNVPGTQDTKVVGSVEPVDARSRFAELFDMA